MPNAAAATPPVPDHESPPGHRGHRGTRAIQRLVEYAPSTGGLALWVAHQDLPADDGSGFASGALVGATPGAAQVAAPLISTDGHTIRYAPAFEQLPLAEQAGWVAHEVLHIALRHPARFLDLKRLLGDADLQLFNLCADAIVNSTLAHLGWLQLPVSALTLDRLLASTLGVEQGAEVALLEWDVERLYRAIDDRQTPAPGRQRNQRNQRPTQRGGSAGGAEGGSSTAAATAGQGAGPDPAPGAAPSPAPVDGPRAARVRAHAHAAHADLQPDPLTQGPPEAQAEQARVWSERLLRAHASDGDFSMLRTLLADLPHSRTPWEQVLRTLLARALSMRRGVSWSRPSRSYIANQGRTGAGRRMPWEPGFSATTAVPRLVLIVDVSGSVDDALMARFAREIVAITRRLESGVVLVIGDQCVQRVQRFEPGRLVLADIVFQGGGGTDFTPLLEEADKHRPDIAVVLTDLDGPARWRPGWPVIWAVPEAHAAAVAPFGRKLVLR